MYSFVLRRLAVGLLILWGVYTLTFFAVNLAPGDPFAELEKDPRVEQRDIDRLRARWGYDRPVLERYLVHLRGVLALDLGTSVARKEPVLSYLVEPLVNSLILGAAALALNFALGLLVGVVSAVRRNTHLDRTLTLGALFVYSMPGFWLALMLIFLVSVKLRLLPVEGMHDVGESGLLDLLEHLVLPAVVLGVGGAAATARYQRSALIEVLGQDFIRTARAKGLPEWQVVWKHAMRNALLASVTLLGLSLPFLVSGAVIVEQVFSWPGIGREVVAAVDSRDVFILTGITLITSAVVVAGNLLADVLYAVVDPRLRV